MKKIPYLVILMFFAFITSCEKENMNSVEVETANLSISNERGGQDCTSEQDFFERQLHWFSFIAAEVLAENNSARQEVALYLSVTSNDNINAEDLIGSMALPGFSNFSADFYDTLLAHLDPQYPTQGGNHPPSPVEQGGWPQGTPAEVRAMAFYNHILKYNCVELYFPNGVDLSTRANLTSSAHPLTQADCNEGYFYLYTQFTQSFSISGIELDQNYLNTHDNVLIARPFRLVTPECTYSQYIGIDFEDFMD